MVELVEASVELKIRVAAVMVRFFFVSGRDTMKKRKIMPVLMSGVLVSVSFLLPRCVQ